MKKIRTYGFYLLGVAILLAGCMKDDAATPGPCPAGRLTLLLPDAQQVAVTRAATTAECRIGNLFVLVYRGDALVHKQAFTAAAVTGNGTAQPSVEVDYNLRADDKVHVVANYAAAVGTLLQGLGTGSAESGLPSLLVYDNPVLGRVMQRSEVQPMYGTVVWAAGPNTCTLVRSLAKVSVVKDDPGLFAGKTVSYIVAGAPEKTSMEVVYDPVADKYGIPGAAAIGAAWSTAFNTDDMIPLATENYCAPYPISTVVGGTTVDKNTFDKRRSALILCAVDASDAKEYYRLDFSRQLSVTTILGDASNEYLDIDPNTHYAFHITGVKGGGYASAAEAWKNPGSNVEYTVTVSGEAWRSSTSNGQYLVKTDRDTVLLLKNVATASELARFACQMPDAGQKPGGELPGSVDTRTVTLVGADKKRVIPVEEVQLCMSDGTPVSGNTFDFSGESIPAGGYLLKYISGADMPAGAMYAKVCYGNIEHCVPLVPTVFAVDIPVTEFAYDGQSGNAVQVQSHYYDVTTGKYVPCAWKTEFSVDGGATWTASKPSFFPVFPADGAGSNPDDLAAYPADFVFNVGAQTPIVENPHNDVLRKTLPVSGIYDLSTKDGTEAMNTANCYVVNAPGTYRFPLVYGNAIKDGAPYSKSYTSTASGSNILTAFVNHLDVPISDPYIYKNANCEPANACLVWQDADGLVRNVALMADGENISFEVPSATIRQGNALIAVRDAAGAVLWSWHIWVTDYEPGSDLKTVTNYQNVRYKFLPVNIGWCDAENLTFDARHAMVRFTQPRSGAERVVTVTQKAHTDVYSGNQPYFQFGRKDPMLPGIRKTNGAVGDKDYYPAGGYAFDKSGTGKVSIGEAIRNPHVFYNYGGSGITDWCATSYYNMWSADNSVTTGNDNPVVKTVYDPSPVGFHVPASNAFTGFTYSGQAVSGDYHGTRYNSPYTAASDVIAKFGWEFYCNRMYGEASFNPSGGTIFFSASGYRDFPSGTVYNVGSSGYCWSAVPYSLSYGRGLYFYSAEVDPWYNYYRSYGFAVYPVQD